MALARHREECLGMGSGIGGGGHVGAPLMGEGLQRLTSSSHISPAIIVSASGFSLFLSRSHMRDRKREGKRKNRRRKKEG